MLLGFFALHYLSLSREDTGEQRKARVVGKNVRDGTLNRFLSSCTKTGGYKKSEDGEFLATGGPPYTPHS